MRWIHGVVHDTHDPTRGGMRVEDVNDSVIRNATLVLCRTLDPDVAGDYAEAAARSFLGALDRHESYAEGVRLALFGWPHVKWRYRVARDQDDRDFGKRDFAFVIYLNCTDIVRPAIAPQARRAAEELRGRSIPVVVEE